VDERGERTVAFAAELHRLAVPRQARAAFDDAVPAFRLETFQMPRRGALDVLAPEHRLQLRAADLAGQEIHLIVGNRAELALHFLWQHDAEFAFEQIGHAAFAGLRIHADDFAIFATD